MPPAEAATAETPSEPGADVELPLQGILEKLPQDLRGKMTMRIEDLGDATIAIPLDQIMPQLGLGSVKITFGQLRGAAPELFRVAEEYDSLPVLLPLNILLARLNPNHLPRHPNQQRIDVPQEIKGPFGARADGVAFATSFMKAPPGPVRVPGAESQTKLTPRAVVTPPPAFTRPAPAAPVPPPPAAAPVPPPPVAAPKPPAPAPAAPITPISPIAPPAPVAPRSINPAVPPKPIAMPGAKPTPPPSAPIPFTPKPPAPVPAAPAPVAAPQYSMPVQAAPGVTPAAAGKTIVMSLADLSEKWPEAVKAEIRQLDLTQTGVALPVNLVEPPLRRGRVIMSWQNIRSLMTPPQAGASSNDGMELELPLKIIVPLYLEAVPPIRPPMRMSVDRSIPNLFFGFPSAEMEAPVAAPVGEAPPAEPKPAPKPIAPAPAAPAAVAPVPPASTVAPPVVPPPPRPAAPAPPAPRPVVPMQPSQAADTNFFLPADAGQAPPAEAAGAKPIVSDTEIKRRLSTPKEIVERAMAIPGVAGAVIALPDGLKVAGQVPPELNSDMVAAFIPQIFDRVGQSTRELRMGALNNLKFTVGNVPWKIFRVNAVYFAAFGRAGERLPTADLAKLASELDRKTK